MDAWDVVTDASLAAARAATGIIEWETRDGDTVWTVESRGIAVATVRALRRAGHGARSRKVEPVEAAAVMAALRRIGAARRAWQKAREEVEAAAGADEKTLMRLALDHGIEQAEVARAGGVDRQWVYKVAKQSA